MNAVAASWTRWVASLMIAMLAGCSVPAVPDVVEPSSAPAAAGVPVVLKFSNHVATATLSDTPESRQLVAMLPATIDLNDVWGQAKSGRLPYMLTAQGSAPVHDPVPGDIYFWPTSEVIAVYYTDLGQTVPDPGLIRLGAIDTGLDHLAHAGRRTTVYIEPAATAHS